MTFGAAGRDAERPVLTGRETEVEQVLRSIGPRPDGSERGLLLLGEEGIGRTSLLGVARAQASRDGALVLSAHGWGVERERPYACLHQLLHPVIRELDVLPEPARRALGAALTPVPGQARPSDRCVQEAVLTLLQHLAAARPALLTLDDIQDCDRASLDVIGAVLRHLRDDGVSVLLAVRGAEAPPGLPAELARLHLAPLDPTAAAALLDAQPGAPRGRRRLELLEEAEGNPLALLELCRMARAEADQALPGSGGAQVLVPWTDAGTVLAGLPEDTRRALLHAALAGPGASLAVVTAALGAADLGVWAPAEEAGVVTVADLRIWFRHPLLRRAATLRHPVQQRRAACLDLAAASRSPADRARYRAEAALGPDESIARALEATAWESQDAFAAAVALERAAGLSPDASAVARRLAEALVAAVLVGDPDWVGDLYRQFTQVPADTETDSGFLAAVAKAAALSLDAQQREAFDLLTNLHERDLDGSAVALLRAVAASVADQSALPEHRERLAAFQDRAEGAHALGHGVGRPVSWLDGPHLRASLDAIVSAAAQPGEASRLLRVIDPPRPGGHPEAPSQLARRMAVAGLACRADDTDEAVRQYRAADALLRTHRAHGARAWTLIPLAECLMAAGRWDEAEALLSEGRGGTALLGQSRVRADVDALTRTLAALRGRIPADPSVVDVGPPALDLRENRATQARLLRASGLAAGVQGDWTRAFRRLRSLFDEDGVPVHPFLAPRAIADLAVAANRSGREAEAARILARVRAREGERPSIRMTLLLHHAAALVDPEHDPEQHFQLAVVNAEGERWPWERAGARLDYAIWLRRSRRPLDAREQLAAALETAEALGAEPLAAAARAELRAAGASTAAERGAPPELTAQQWQIVKLAADGLSNREIGAQLFLSPRTVGTHLYNVYPKLGVSRRHQLRDLVAAVEGGAD